MVKKMQKKSSNRNRTFSRKMTGKHMSLFLYVNHKFLVQAKYQNESRILVVILSFLEKVIDALCILLGTGNNFPPTVRSRQRIVLSVE